jgi:predicted O-methyltransferase YrrM
LRHRIARRFPPIASLLRQRDSLGARVRTLESELDTIRRSAEDAPQMFPPGHYYSPVPSLADISARQDSIFAVPNELPEIDLAEQEQLGFLRDIAPFAQDADLVEHATQGHRYYLDNDFFSFGDGVVLQSILRSQRPRRLIEVGSGYSSALILDTNERYLNGALHCTFIEPDPERLHGLLNNADRDRCEIVVSPLQDLDLTFIDELGPNDVLFIDSSHVSKAGSDVNLLIFDVLPRLQSGVFVHFHDIFYPFEYLKEWVREGRCWNEAYILRAYLQRNSGYRIRLWNSYLAECHRDETAALLPRWDRNTGGSLWLQRT